MAHTVMVTGADGFIGSHLTEELVKRGEKVRAFCLYNSFGSLGWIDTLPPEITNLIPPAPQAPEAAPAQFTAPFTSVGQRAADAAQTKLGAPYVYGATGPSSFMRSLSS